MQRTNVSCRLICARRKYKLHTYYFRAFVPKESLRKRKKSKIGNIEIDIVEIDEAPKDNNEETKKKRKYRSLDVTDFASSTPNNTKRLKNCMGTINVTIKEEERRINKSSEISSTSNDQMPPPTSASKEKIQRASMKDQPNSPEENKTVVSQDNFAVNEQVSRKSKRKSTVNNSGYNDDITSNEEPISKTKATENTKHKLSKSLEDNTSKLCFFSLPIEVKRTVNNF